MLKTISMVVVVVEVVNFINVSRPHSLGKSHTNLGTQLTDIKNMYKDNLKYLKLYKMIMMSRY